MAALPPTVTIHHAGDHSVDGVLRLIAVASDPASPLEVALAAMCREIAAITGADVVSAYVREPDDCRRPPGDARQPRLPGAGTIGAVAARLRRGG
jgi:hypothetical protein